MPEARSSSVGASEQGKAQAIVTSIKLVHTFYDVVIIGIIVVPLAARHHNKLMREILVQYPAR